MLPVSDFFRQQEQAVVNTPKAQVLIAMGNLALNQYGTASASSVDGSGNYPAAGAFDGDRSELNIGAPGNSDNGIGKSCWRSGAIGTGQTLTFTFNNPTVMNRIKLYQLTGYSLKSFKFQCYYSGSAGPGWYTVAHTSDIVDSGTSFNTTGKLDLININLALIDSANSFLLGVTGMRIEIFSLTGGDGTCYVNSFEAYNVVDVSSRCMSTKVNRQRDYSLKNPLAADCEIVCDNSDGFFSQNSAINPLWPNLLPNMGITINYGFDGVEWATTFTGFMDELTLSPTKRTATITGRDGMKAVINTAKFSQLLSGQYIETIIGYLVQQCGFSPFEYSGTASAIAIPYFYVDIQNNLTSIQDLVVAAGDASFYFDESGIATFKYYGSSTPGTILVTTQADWNAGTTKQNVAWNLDVDQLECDLCIIDRFEDGDLTNNPTWTITKSNPGLNDPSASSFYLSWAYSPGVGSSADGVALSTALNTAYGTWQFDLMAPSAGGVTFPQAVVQFIRQSFDGSGYYISFNGGYISLVSTVNGLLGNSTAGWSTGAYHTITVTRDYTNAFKVYVDGVLVIGPVGNTSVTTCDTFEIRFPNYGGTWEMRKIGYFRSINTAGSVIGYQGGEWINSFDCSAACNGFGNFYATQYIPPGTGSIQYFLSTSPDNSTWSTDYQVYNGQQIDPNLPVQRWVRMRLIIIPNMGTNLNIGPGDDVNNCDTSTPIVYDFTINYKTGTGTPRYPGDSEYIFAYNSLTLDMELKISDSIGGSNQIINDVTVTSNPVVLLGNTTDTVWQGTVQSPPVKISAGTPLSVTNGQVLTFQVQPSTPMDVSLMTGANPAAAVVTFAGGGAGSWIFTRINPTNPVLQITITGTGTITDLRVIGKTFQGGPYSFSDQALSANSIQLYGDRALSIDNDFITTDAMAKNIAALYVAYNIPKYFINKFLVRPTFSIQLGDRISAIDVNTGLVPFTDFYVAGVLHTFSVSDQSGQIETELTLIACYASGL